MSIRRLALALVLGTGLYLVCDFPVSFYDQLAGWPGGQLGFPFPEEFSAGSGHTQFYLGLGDPQVVATPGPWWAFPLNDLLVVAICLVLLPRFGARSVSIAWFAAITVAVSVSVAKFVGAYGFVLPPLIDRSGIAPAYVWILSLFVLIAVAFGMQLWQRRRQ